ncbi:SLC13 family permease [Anaeromicropila herbilytica]|uniref:Anion transporter n=1 Tax=Anaeromicropila herbilytica TaxID=2785025 RepID=A0A7R7EHI2_9FIRM|nr:SLC13 family permease [Anaeromicropila herbilytica]BCN28946.1 anion transporter [Anaeromicropila herbilytica]
MIEIIKKSSEWIKKETVLVVSAIAAFISMLFVPFNIKDYVTYIDFRVLAILFCLMAVISGFQKINVFDVLARKLLLGVKDTRKLVFLLVLLCFGTSMWITNDVSLIAFVPFTILVLQKIKKEKLLIYVIVMQTIAANLGSMLTPVGNPQNLYLYSHYGLSALEFFKITIPIVIVSFFCLIACIFFVEKEEIVVELGEIAQVKEQKKFVIYVLLFVLCIATVFHVLPYYITLAFTCFVLIIIDASIFVKIDYSLLATFICFFLFVGNVGGIEFIKDRIGGVIRGKELFASILMSQGISNVPAAVLLSSFTENAKGLIMGTNIGGLGTLIASLASLISYKLYSRTEGARSGRYLWVFTKYNVLFLVILISVTRLL